jgi:hypothetical protein
LFYIVFGLGIGLERHRPDLNRDTPKGTGLAIPRSTRLCHGGICNKRLELNLPI